MSAIIEDLKKEHEIILNQLLEVKRYGVHTMEGRDQLMLSRNQLMEHLEGEDSYMYPLLEDAAKYDTELAEMLRTFYREMNEITNYCYEFFEKYSAGGGGIEFFRDFENLQLALKNRIEKEEHILFSRYDQLIAKQNERRENDGRY